MKNNSFKIIFLFALLILVCTMCIKTETPAQKLNFLLKKHVSGYTVQDKLIIIIPLYGCSVYVDKAINFMKEQAGSESYIFFLSCLFQKEFDVEIGGARLFLLT